MKSPLEIPQMLGTVQDDHIYKEQEETSEKKTDRWEELGYLLSCPLPP